MTTPSSDPLGVGVTGVPPVVVQSPPSTTAETDTAGTVDTDTAGAVDTDTASAVDTVTTGTAGPAPSASKLGGGYGPGDEITQSEVDIVTTGTTGPAPALGGGGGDQNAQAVQNEQASGTAQVMINIRRKCVTILVTIRGKTRDTWVILKNYIGRRDTTRPGT